MRIFLSLTAFFFLTAFTAHAAVIEGRVVSVLPEARSFEVTLSKSEGAQLEVGSTQTFRVGAGDLVIGYAGRTIRANAAYFGKNWNLEQVFPLDGLGAKAARDVNHQLHQATASMSRRKFVRQGDYIPNFAMIDQRGEFLQARQLQGKPFMLNFIFTRCTIPTMCPASSLRMADMQEAMICNLLPSPSTPPSTRPVFCINMQKVIAWSRKISTCSPLTSHLWSMIYCVSSASLRWMKTAPSTTPWRPC